MLGLKKHKSTWNWAACGKHPVARDYFRLSLSTPLLVAFESWVEKGFRILCSSEISERNMYSWRFWAKGLKKGSLICGVGKDSSDSMGRPYPLFFMGDGILEGWENHWDLLPDAFERTWDQIEYISSRRFDNLKRLENEVCAIKNPKPDWLKLKSQNKTQRRHQASANAFTISKDNHEIRKKANHLSKKMEVLVFLDSRPDEDPFAMASLWSSLLKANSSDVPNALFIGGVPEKHFLAVFNRPLNANDFVQLWSVSSN
jgi:TagF N-terminal domain, Type VI secretion system-associated